MKRLNLNREWGVMEKLLVWFWATDKHQNLEEYDWKDMFRALTGCSEADLEGAIAEAKALQLITPINTAQDVQNRKDETRH